MESKICSKCLLEKIVTEFNLHSTKYPILKPYCKSCQKEYDNYYIKTPHGLITSLYKSLKSSSKSRKHPMPLFSKDEFIDWLYKNDYSTIYTNWVLSKYDRNKRPSVDRLEDNKNYFFKNMRLVTWEENDKKYKDSVKIPVIVLDLEDNSLKRYESVRFTSRELGINNCTILYNLNSENVINERYIFRTTNN